MGRCRRSFTNILVYSQLGLAVPTGMVVGAELSAVPVEVLARQGTVDAEVGAAPLAEVLREVAEEVGFSLEVQGDLGEVRAQTFDGVPLDEAIRRLVGDNRVNLLFRYETDVSGERHLFEVHARAAGEVPAEVLEERRMRKELNRVAVPPPPPPPPNAQ